MRVALLVLYNHRYTNNINTIKRIYEGRFQHVFQLIPFYEGNDPSVISVYGSSFYFHSFIAQAYQHLKGKGFTHYFIVADDMVINPKINELNFLKMIGLSEDDAYISNLQPIHTAPGRMPWLDNVLKHKIKQPGLEIEQILPTKEEAESRFRSHGIPVGAIPIRCFFKFYKLVWWKSLYFFIKQLPLIFKRNLDYPVLKAYSDILIVPASYMDKFATYCGAFSASCLFVEYAIPTSLLLVVDSSHIKTDNDVILKYGAIWSKPEHQALEDSYSLNINELIERYPSDKLFIHPIKLSRWKFV